MKTEDLKDVNQVASTPPTVVQSTSQTHRISLYERFGNAIIQWYTDGPTGDKDNVTLYKGQIPSNPNSEHVFIGPADKLKTGDYDTKQPWGTGWYAGYFGMDYSTGLYTFYAVTPQTSE